MENPSDAYEFFVEGHPCPAGSKTAKVLKRGGKIVYGKNGNPVVVTYDANGQKAGNWKKHVGQAAFNAVGRVLLRGPVELELCFVAERPKTHFRSGKFAHLLRSDAPLYPIGRPDVLKLARAVEDGLTQVLWHDDAQIVDERLSKVYGSPEGVIVRVTPKAGGLVEPQSLLPEEALPF